MRVRCSEIEKCYGEVKMINKIVQCVPNFSEGRRVEVIEEIVGAIGGTEGVKVLDYSYDQSHNRSVATFIGARNRSWKLLSGGLKKRLRGLT